MNVCKEVAFQTILDYLTFIVITAEFYGCHQTNGTQYSTSLIVKQKIYYLPESPEQWLL